MSQYMLSVHHVEGEAFPPAEEMQPVFDAVDRFNDKLQAEGVWVFAGGLHPRESATTVDGRGPEPVLRDGPFAESKEWLRGFLGIEGPPPAAGRRSGTQGGGAR